MKLKLYIPVLIVCLTQAVSCGQRDNTHGCACGDDSTVVVAPEMDSSDFVRIDEAVPDVILEIRYYSTYNFIAARSSHSRGSTADLTLFDMKTGREVDMGAPFDWFGQESFPDTYFDFPVSIASIDGRGR